MPPLATPSTSECAICDEGGTFVCQYSMLRESQSLMRIPQSNVIHISGSDKDPVILATSEKIARSHDFKTVCNDAGTVHGRSQTESLLRLASSPHFHSPIHRVSSESDFPKGVEGGHITPSSVPKVSQIPEQSRHQEYNENQAENFAQQIATGVNDGAICVLISLGHQLGLFATLSRLSPEPCSAEFIAQAAQSIHTRNLEEWLTSMTCVGILEEVECRGEVAGTVVKRYVLPAEHALFLTWTDQSNNLALLAQYIPILGRLQHRIVNCFKTGDGLPPSCYEHLDSVASLDILQTVGCRFEQEIVRYVDGLHEELTRGCSVLCIGGNGDGVYVNLASCYPNSWFTSYEPSILKMNAACAMNDAANRAKNIHFKVLPGGMHTMQEGNSYDVALLFDSWSVLQSAEPMECLRAIARSLRPGKPLLYLETMANGCVTEDRRHPAGRFLYSLVGMYLLPVSMANAPQRADVAGLWGHLKAREALLTAGFEQVEVRPLENDELNCVLIASTKEAGG